MMFSLLNWLRPRRGTIVNRTAGRKKTTCKLHLETLEDRCVPSTIQGTVFNDANNNGVFDAGDSGLAGWTVFLDANTYNPSVPDLGRFNAILDPGEPATTTDAIGHYSLTTTDTGWTYDRAELLIQVGSGGIDRWLNTTGTSGTSNKTTDLDQNGNAIRNFGVHFESFLPDIGVVPAGPETLVNYPTAGQQSNGDVTGVSADAAGNYVVAWRTVVPGGTDTISARVFDAHGTALTGDITVANVPNSPNLVPFAKVAMAGDGSRFMVAWDSASGNYGGVCRADTGAAVGSCATLLGTVGGVAADTNGNFVVASQQVTISKSGFSNRKDYAQRFTSAGVANGSAITVATPGLYDSPYVAMDGPGNFVVVWADDSLYAQRFNASGKKNGPTITVMSGTHGGPIVAMNTSGQFVVTVEGMAKRFNADGTPWGAAVPISASGSGYSEIGTAIDGAGNVTFAWTEAQANSDSIEVRMQRLTAAGTLTPETIVNTTTQGSQSNPGVAATGNGTFVVAWQGYGAGDNAGIFAQRDGLPVQIGTFTASANPTAGSPVTFTVSNITDANPNPVITQVAFYEDTNGDVIIDSGDSLLGYGTQTSPGVWTFTFTFSTPGSYNLLAQALDNYGVLSDPLELDLVV